MVDHPALAMARLQGSNIKAVRNQGWLNACGVALGVLGAPLDAVAFVDCNYLIETCTEMYGIMRNVCKGIEIYTLNIHFYTHTHMETACITSYFRFHIVREHHIRGIQWLRSPSWLQWEWSGSSRCSGVSSRCWHIKNTIYTKII